MNLLWLFHSSKIGGAPLTGIEAIEALGRRGHRTLAVVPEDGGLTKQLSARGIEYVVVPNTRWVRHKGVRDPWLRWRRIPRTVRAALSIARLARRRRIDLIVTSTITFPSGALGARLAGVPHIWFIQEYGYDDFGTVFDWGESRSLRWIDRWSSRVMVHAPALYDRFQGAFPPGKLALVTAGVDVPASERRSARARGGTFRLILVATLHATKGQPDAIRATAVLAGQGRDVHLDLVGAGTARDRKKLESLASSLGVSNRVSFLGFREDRLKLVEDADAALLCSRSEALGRAAIEAMKIGLPLVAAASGTGSYIVEDGVSGLLYHPGDAAELASKIALLMDDPSRAEAIGRRAREAAVARFSVERLGDDVERLALAAIHGGDARAATSGADTTSPR